MKFEPRNRHILVEKIEKNEEQSNVLLPEGYKQIEEYVLLRVLCTSPDCSVIARKGEKVVVPTHLVQDINVGDQHFSIVLENHICGVIYNK
jgi:co-chaperonin GroES (HSP10)|tara:strand:- start:367 stop:639 length:273 start_codon:yes stop_codon:yes gene_type:complete